MQRCGLDKKPTTPTGPKSITSPFDASENTQPNRQQIQRPPPPMPRTPRQRLVTPRISLAGERGPTHLCLPQTPHPIGDSAFSSTSKRFGENMKILMSDGTMFSGKVPNGTTLNQSQRRGKCSSSMMGVALCLPTTDPGAAITAPFQEEIAKMCCLEFKGLPLWNHW